MKKYNNLNETAQKELTPEQSRNLSAKFEPQEGKHYIVTDQCFWFENKPEDYNIFDKERKPHCIQLVDLESGTVVNLPSGSVIQVLLPPKQ